MKKLLLLTLIALNLIAAPINTLALTYGEKCKELGVGLKECVLFGESGDSDKTLANLLPDAEVIPEAPVYSGVKCLGAEIGSDNGGYLVVDRALLDTVIANGTYNGYTVSQVCTSNVTDMSFLFYPVSQGGTAPDGFNSDISNFDTSNVTNMYGMFASASSFNQPVNFDTTNVTNMESMFYEAASFNQPVNFDTSNVTTMQGMFIGATSFNQPVNFDTTNVTTMYVMFAYASSFNQLVNFNTSKVTNMSDMFYGASSFNQPVNFTDTSNVTDMSYMFGYASSFNQPVNFDTSNVTNMHGMFYSASNFNQNISNWCVSKISSEPSNFSTSSPLTTANKPKWGTCP